MHRPWRPDPIVRRELKLLERRGVLGDGEIVCELQDVAMDLGPGALVLTDLRLLAVSTSLLRRGMRLVSIPLERVEHVEAGATKMVAGLWRKHGSLTIRWQDVSGTDRTLELDRITGGGERAKEIADSIILQRTFLEPLAGRGRPGRERRRLLRARSRSRPAPPRGRPCRSSR